jgi:hypothetical protein
LSARYASPNIDWRPLSTALLSAAVAGAAAAFLTLVNYLFIDRLSLTRAGRLEPIFLTIELPIGLAVVGTVVWLAKRIRDRSNRKTGWAFLAAAPFGVISGVLFLMVALFLIFGGG